MEERYSEKLYKYSSPLQSKHNYLHLDIRMLEERLQNLEYLKQTYERNAKEKSIEIEYISRELNNCKSELYEKNRKIQELSHMHSTNEASMRRVIGEHSMNKSLLEEEISNKDNEISQLENNIQEQYEQNLKIIDENQELREKMKEKERVYLEHIALLEERLRDITISQRITEERVNSAIYSATPKRKARVRREDSSNVGKLYRKELAINKSLKNVITDLYKHKPEEIQERLLYSEKKIRELESALESTSKIQDYSSMTTLKNTAKLRSSSQSLKQKGKIWITK